MTQNPTTSHAKKMKYTGISTSLEPREWIQRTDVTDRLQSRRETEGIDQRAQRGAPTLQGQSLGSVLVA
jgi:hypothetical protein